MWVRPVGRLPDDCIEEGRQAGAFIDLSLKSPWQLFAAWDGDTLYGWLGLLLRSQNTVTVRGWYVKPDHRNQGAGSALLASAVDWALSNGYQKIEIRTSHDVSWAGFEWKGYQKSTPPFEKHYVRGAQDRLCLV